VATDRPGTCETELMIRAGAKLYFEGARCYRGHTLRYRSTNNCVECSRLPRARARRAARDVKPATVDVPIQDDRRLFHHDPGTRVSPERIDAVIDRVFGNGPRLANRALLG
jgi:hypothetical protein